MTDTLSSNFTESQHSLNTSLDTLATSLHTLDTTTTTTTTNISSQMKTENTPSKPLTGAGPAVRPQLTHPLQTQWLLTYKTNKPPVSSGSGKGFSHVKKQQQNEHDWLASFQTVSLIATVELFWEVKNNIIGWSKLSNGSIYAFFKEGINPSWEDPANKEGCSYMFYMNQSKLRPEDIDNIFESALLFLIGECSDYSDAINGITFERKQRGDKMILWCNSHSDEMLLSIKNGLFPDNIVNFVSLECKDFNNPNIKVSTEIVDHKSALARLSIPSKPIHHSNHANHHSNHHRYSDKKNK